MEAFFIGIPKSILKNKTPIVLIAKETIDTGVTVKPLDVNVLELLPGLTDQTVPKMTQTSHLEGRYQLMRLYGWFPQEHRSTLWVYPGDQDIHNSQMGKLHCAIMTQHKGQPVEYLEVGGNNSIHKITCTDSYHDKRIHCSNCDSIIDDDIEKI